MTEEQKAGKILLFCKESSQERIMKCLRDAFDVPGSAHDTGLELHNGNLNVTLRIYCESAGGEEQELVFQCEKAKVAAPFSVYASISKPNGFPIENTELEQKIRDFADAQPPLPYEGHTGELENVLSALENDTLPAIGGEDGRRTIELITAIYKSGATKQTVTLPLQKDDPFYTVEGMMRAVPHFYEKTTSAASLDGTITLGSDYQQK